MSDKSNLIKAVIAVMNDVKNIEKNMTVGEGNNSYKGVSDKDVKLKVGESMAKNGLALLCTNIEQNMNVERWVDQYGKPKQSVFTEVKNTYVLFHESGESIEIQGYGHGIDSQDKSAGKATTYALKNALLYTFLVPTGSIDDTDNTHSDKIETPPAQQTPPYQSPRPQSQPQQAASNESDKPWLNLFDRDKNVKESVLAKLQGFFAEGKSIDDLKQSVKISKVEMEYIQTNILGHK